MKRTPTKSVVNRKILFFALFALLEIATIVILLVFSRNWVPGNILSNIEVAFRIISAFLAFYIIFVRKDRSEYRFLWLFMLIIEPIIGSVFYLLFAEKRPPERFRRNKDKVINPNQDGKVNCNNLNQSIYPLANFIFNTQHQRVYDRSKVDIFMPCDNVISSLINDIKNAKHYVLLETFIMSSGKFLNIILNELEKRRDLKVYFYIDDFGSFSSIKRADVRRIKAIGINFVRYNKINLFFRSSSNYRNHRKIIVIDGKIVYTGGANIADEYLNWKDRFGHWFDCFLRIEGDCAESFVKCFESDWESLTNISFLLPEVSNCHDTIDDSNRNDYFSFDKQLQMYTSSPTNDKDISNAEEILVSLILSARKRISIITPYLSLTPLIYNSLLFAKKSGVDIDIVIPGIPDKNFVYLATLNTAEKLEKNCVKVYIYKGGFTHAKLMIIDDVCVNISTINFDYRSFYFSFELGVNIYTQSFCKNCEEEFLKLRDRCELFKPKPKTIKSKFFESLALILRSYF